MSSVLPHVHSPESSSHQASPASAIATVSIHAAAGTMAGLSWAIAFNLRHEHVAHGFYRNAFYAARENGCTGLAVGTLIGVAFALLARVRDQRGNRLFGEHRIRNAMNRFAEMKFLFIVAASTSFAIAVPLTFADMHAMRITVVVSSWIVVLIGSAMIVRRGHLQLVVGGVLPASALTLTSLAWMNGKRSLGESLGRIETIENVALLGIGFIIATSLVWQLSAGFAADRIRQLPGRAGGIVIGLGGLLLFAIVAASVTEQRVFARAEHPNNVILIGIDTQRSDHMALTQPGPGERNLTPHIRTLADRGITFANAISQAPWTIPAFSSVLTGKYPLEHGAVSLRGRLPDAEAVLGEWMREAGYFTASVIGPGNVHTGTGFNQGYDVFNDAAWTDHKAITSSEITNTAIELMRDRPRAPFFLFLHYFDPHSDFRKQPEFPFGDWYTGWLAGDDTFSQREALHSDSKGLSADDLRYVVDLYDGEVAHTDFHIGRLLKYLEDEGLMDKTAIILTSDHGEEFSEHGWIGHTIHMYDHTVKVPLIAHLPGAFYADASSIESGLVVDEVVETRGVFELVLDYVNWGGEYGSIDSKLIAAAKRAQHGTPDPDASAFSIVRLDDAPEGSKKRARRSSLRTNQYKFIIDHESGTHELYDIAADPMEYRNLASEGHPAYEELRLRLTNWIKAQRNNASTVPVQRLDKERIRQLRSLGYL